MVSAENATSPGKSNQKLSIKKTYGVYFLNILLVFEAEINGCRYYSIYRRFDNNRCAYDEYDITFEPEKTSVEFRNWDCVLNSVLSVVNDFLKKNGLFLTMKSDETHLISCQTSDLVRSKVSYRKAEAI